MRAALDPSALRSPRRSGAPLEDAALTLLEGRDDVVGACAPDSPECEGGDYVVLTRFVDLALDSENRATVRMVLSGDASQLTPLLVLGCMIHRHTVVIRGLCHTTARRARRLSEALEARELAAIREYRRLETTVEKRLPAAGSGKRTD